MDLANSSKDHSFDNLLSEARIGHLTLRNRMVMPSMGTNYGTSDGFVTPRLIDYYEARAAGGVGLVVVEVGCVEFPRGKALVNQLGLDDDKFLAGLADLAAAIKRHGALAMIQLHHAGREARTEALGILPVGPSAIPSVSAKRAAPRELAVSEIRELVDRFVDGAVRIRRAGFDGVEVHAAVSYLLGQFLSPLTNRRTDDYGGTLRNRARMAIEVVDGIRKRLGADFCLGIRITSDEVAEGGITIDEACETATLLEQAGADFIDVIMGGISNPESIIVAPASFPPGYQLHLAARLKQSLQIPLIAGGRINTPLAAEAALVEGTCDLVALGRALIADPEFPRKVAVGRIAEIRPCTACLNCIHNISLADVEMVCANNPAAGREREFEARPTEARKRVFVIGGGPAGMEAARTAAVRGHDVKLLERRHEIGGQLIPAARAPGKIDLDLLRAYYERQLAKATVHTVLGEVVDVASIKAAQPNAVIIATGSQPRLPEIPGSEGSNVVFATDVLGDKAATGQHVVVIGGQMVACETAEYLASLGRQVILVYRGHRLASRTRPMLRRPQINRLAQLGVTVLVDTQCEEINDHGVVTVNGHGDRRLLEAQTVVLATGSAPSTDLAQALQGQVPMLLVVGDAIQPRGFLEAIREGMLAGMAV